VIIRGSKDLEIFVREFSDKFKELIGKEMSFELKEEAVKEEQVEEKENQDNGKEEGR
jgi:hypothetical protein